MQVAGKWWSLLFGVEVLWHQAAPTVSQKECSNCSEDKVASDCHQAQVCS